MEKFVQLNETILIAKERLSFYETNNFTPLFDLGNSINNKLDSIENMVDTMIDKHTSKIDYLETEEAKQQWYTEFLRDLTHANQALYGVMVIIEKKIK